MVKVKEERSVKEQQRYLALNPPTLLAWDVASVGMSSTWLADLLDALAASSIVPSACLYDVPAFHVWKEGNLEAI